MMSRLVRREYLVSTAVPLLAAILGCPLSGIGAETVIEVRTLSGQNLEGRVIHWTEHALSILTTNETVVPIEELWAIRFPRQTVRPWGGSLVVLANSDRFVAQAVKSDDDLLTAEWPRAPLRSSLELPLELVAGMAFDLPPAPDVVRATLLAIQRQPSGHDTVTLLTGDSLDGELLGLEGGLVDFEGSLGRNKLDRKRVRAIALDPDLATKTVRPETCWIAQLVDGSRFTATACAPRDDFSVEFVLSAGPKLRVPWHELSSLLRLGPRVAPLSQRRPKEIRHVPFLGGERTPVMDRSIAGSPLRMRGQEYAFGLGLTSRMTLTYAIEPGDVAFESDVGIDDAANKAGSIRARVRIDDQQVWESPELTGRQEPLRLPRLALVGHRTLTLEIDFGQHGDAGDLADWGHAAILRTPALTDVSK